MNREVKCLKKWVVLTLFAFVLITVGQWISGLFLTFMYEPERDSLMNHTNFWLFIQTLVIGTGFWALHQIIQKRKDVHV